MSLIGFAVSALWMDLIANELVALLKTIGLISGISQDILGITVLAWANSVGDLVADVKVAKAGYATMAATACFASPMFNQMIGLGIGFLLKFRTDSPPYSVQVSGNNVLSFSFLIATCCVSCAVAFWNYRSKRRFGRAEFVFLMGCYCVFIVLSILCQTRVFTIPPRPE